MSVQYDKTTGIPIGIEPTDEEIRIQMKKDKENYYNVREKSYGGKPPGGFQSWGDCWKAF